MDVQRNKIDQMMRTWHDKRGDPVYTHQSTASYYSRSIDDPPTPDRLNPGDVLARIEIYEETAVGFVSGQKFWLFGAN